ncbi:hypothetical protein QUF61_13850 [Candidatus Venteria ishoeyi]|uniref:DUF7004 family protein n=1 Tax=Candidatus Venteria ishoeyi TaxID=1899563 RepID=UPI0025A58E0E|nr:hypothetical protein [Candidatus Venteria ishoeyi]MDM8547570.1 hypothetical protein [Candidatus Venteria ishoeyi]
MKTIIKVFSDNSQLEFDRGSFDDWCIYLVSQEQRKPPKDSEYFTRLQALSQIHSPEKIYQDFVKIFDYTNARLNPKMLAGITRLASHYGNDALEMDKLFTILYAGMVAEENKQHAVLKKRIKRLGMHQVLVEGLKPDIAAHFSRGKKWRELDKICREKGF